MARKKPTAFAPTDSTESGVVPVKFEDPRILLTIDADDPIWKAAISDDTILKIPKVSGGIVRIRAPESATGEEVEGLRVLVEMRGAERVFVLPRRRADVIPANVTEANQAQVWTARAAVTALVQESNSKDKGALAKLCEQIMGEVGL